MRPSPAFASHGGARLQRRGLGQGRGLGLGLALGLMLAACGPPPDFGPISVYDSHGFHYESNTLTGTIRISEGCMTVRWQGDDVVLMFPDDEVAWDPEKSILTYAGQAYGDGDTITLEAIVHYGRYSGSIPKACPPSVRVYVLEAGLK